MWMIFIIKTTGTILSCTLDKEKLIKACRRCSNFPIKNLLHNTLHKVFFLNSFYTAPRNIFYLWTYSHHWSDKLCFYRLWCEECEINSFYDYCHIVWKDRNSVVTFYHFWGRLVIFRSFFSPHWTHDPKVALNVWSYFGFSSPVVVLTKNNPVPFSWSQVEAEASLVSFYNLIS